MIRENLLAVFITYILLAGSCAPVQALTESDDIDTNRPTFMDSPLVVPKGSLQLENGTLYQRYHSRNNYFDIPENEVRYGLTKNTELQLFTPSWVHLNNNGSGSQGAFSHNGVSDLQEVGLKHQLANPFKDPFLKSFTVSLIGGVTIPTGRSFISSSGVQPVLRAPYTKSLAKNWSMGGMQSLLVINGGRDVQYQNVITLYRAVGTRGTAFAEYAGFYTHGSAPTNLSHFGFIRKLSRHQQVDVHFGFGLNESSPTAFVGAGYSVRFDKFLQFK